MTMIYMDEHMHLAPALSTAQENDRQQWCPGVAEGALIDSPLNPVIWTKEKIVKTVSYDSIA
jgi:hypothetical protein